MSVVNVTLFFLLQNTTKIGIIWTMFSFISGPTYNTLIFRAASSDNIQFCRRLHKFLIMTLKEEKTFWEKEKNAGYQTDSSLKFDQKIAISCVLLSITV